MSAEDFEVLRRHMLAVISAGTFHVSGLIGKATLDERVMTAMGKIPRHKFVPIELQPYAYAIHFRSASTRRSRSHLLSR